MNASDMMPAVINAMAVPRNGAGMSAASSRSRMAANMTNTSAKPMDAPKPKKTDCTNPLDSCTLSSATPNTAQDFGELHTGSNDENEADRAQILELQRYQHVSVQQVGSR